MSIEAKAGHDSMLPVARVTTGNPIHNFDSSKAKLVADLKMVVADAEQLLREAADSSSEALEALRARFEANLHEATAKLARARAAVGGSARQATEMTHAYVKENPWKIAGVLGAAGLVLGFLLQRK
jgi:ElaB/YqjD/DUF883 family membrane-anchored ribosome-binding protein